MIAFAVVDVPVLVLREEEVPVGASVETTRKLGSFEGPSLTISGLGFPGAIVVIIAVKFPFLPQPQH